MPYMNAPLYALNRGEVSRLALGRVDVDRLRLSMQSQINMQPRVVGPASLRPGLAHLGETRANAAARFLPFVFAADDVAALELTAGFLRVWVDGDALVTRQAVTSTLPSFADGGSWSIIGTGGGATGSIAPAGSPLAALSLTAASEGQRVTAHAALAVPLADRQKEHALRVVVTRGPVKFRVGTVAGLDDVFKTTTLGTGTHSLAFTPYVDTVYPQFESAAVQSKVVGSVAIEGAGVLELPMPYAAANLIDIRAEQSADVVFLACKGVSPYKIERRSTTSWSVARFAPEDGPFGSSGDTATKLQPSDIQGDITLSADRPLFRDGHVGALFRIFHTGQNVAGTLAAADTYTGTIRVSGVSQVQVGTTTTTVNDRNFTVTLDGTYSGKVTLERSLDGPLTGFTTYKTYVSGTNITETIRDGLNNVIAWYRLGFKPGNYTSGSAEASLAYSGGGGTGICRVVSITDSQTAQAEVLRPFLNSTYSNDWKEGEWSDVKGYPSAVALHEGRLWFAGADRVWGSVSDAYSSFDYDTEGDAGTINRSIGKGPISKVGWLMALNRLVIGTDCSAVGARSSSFDEPLTPKNFNLKDIATNGAARLSCAKVDTRGLYVQAGGRRVYEVAWDVQITDYKARDLTRLNDDIGLPGFVSVAVQRQPDTHIHFVRADGAVAALIYDTDDQVEGWWRVETDGVVEDAMVLPGSVEDAVFYLVRRTINGATKRYWERFATQDECQGGALNRIADCHAVFEFDAPVTAVSVPHLVGKTVVLWGDGKDLGTATVLASGEVDLPTPCSNVVVGLGYTGTLVSAKLAYAGQHGTAINQKKKLGKVGLLLAATHARGLRFGQYGAPLQDMPMIEKGVLVDPDSMWDDYDEPMVEVGGEWDADTRLHIECAAPRPATIMGVVVGIDTSG